VPYTVCVPKTETRNEQITVWRDHQVPKTETYTVMVPHTVQKDDPVQVCKMVEQTVEVPCESSCGCSSCGSCGDSCCRPARCVELAADAVAAPAAAASASPFSETSCVSIAGVRATGPPPAISHSAGEFLVVL